MNNEDEKLNQYDSIVAQSDNIKLNPISDGDLRPKNLKTDEEENRDKQITELLTNYVINYRKKIDFNDKYKKVILWFCIGVLGLFLASIITFIVLVSIYKNINVEITVGLSCGILSFVGLFIGVLKIITEYVFPKDEEQYITKIVEDIQKNDLDNKKTDLQYIKNNQKNKF